MQSYLMKTICRTGIFIICAQVLVHFRPNASYEKYMKMLVSSMILLQLLMPISGFFAGDKTQSLAARVEWFEEQLELSMEQAVVDYVDGTAVLEQMTLEEVKSRMEALEAQGEASAEPREPEGWEQEQNVSRIEIGQVEKVRIETQDEQEGGAADDRGMAEERTIGSGNADEGAADREFP